MADIITNRTLDPLDLTLAPAPLLLTSYLETEDLSPAEGSVTS